MQIEAPSSKSPPENKTALFAIGFRPFFLLAGLSAIGLMLVWLWQLSNQQLSSHYYSSITWHSHEMLFAYTVAVIAGFLLTAVGNWTSTRTLFGWPLFLLSLVWIAPRFLAFIPDIPNWTIALIDLTFIPLLTITIAIPLIRAKSWSNLIFIPILLMMALSNLLVHASLLGWTSLPATTGTSLMLYLVILLIVIMGGRVIPFFTERGVSGIKTHTWSWIEKLSILSLVILALADVFEMNKILVGSLAVLTTALHAIRLGGWYSNRIWCVPLVWVLHSAYAWIIVGLIMKSLAITFSTMELYAWHAFTVGGIGIITLGMMARVSLGHTGRMMQASKWITLAFILINITTLIRVIFPIFFQTNYSVLIIISGFLWSIAFALFAIIYTPMFLRSRVDGRPV